MIKLIVMYPWPADPGHFKQHYLQRHVPLCRGIAGMMNSRYAFEPKTIEGTAKWFCIFEAEFTDEAAMYSAFATAEGEKASADVANYSPEPPTCLVYELNPV